MRRNEIINENNIKQVNECKRWRAVVTFAINMDADSHSDAHHKASNMADRMRSVLYKDEESSETKINLVSEVMNFNTVPLVNNNSVSRHVVIPKIVTWKDVQEHWHNAVSYNYDLRGEMDYIFKERSSFMTNAEATVLLRSIATRINESVGEIVVKEVMERFKEKLIQEYDDGVKQEMP